MLTRTFPPLAGSADIYLRAQARKKAAAERAETGGGDGAPAG